MIQDICPHKLWNQYNLKTEAENGDFVFCFNGSKLLMKAGETLEFPRVEDFDPQTQFIYLFSLDRRHFFLAREFGEVPENWDYTDIQTLRGKTNFPKELIFAVLTGKHLADWYRDTQFCGRCGTKMEHSEKERAMCCSKCGNTVYPRIMPAVIVGVTNGDKLLLTQYRVGFRHNALIAGFTEIGETLEETVAREVMEEAGIKVKNIRYYKSQPWGIANDILTGFYCDVDGDTEIHMDAQELKVAHWVERQDIELQPDDFSLTNEMMMMFKNGEQ